MYLICYIFVGRRSFPVAAFVLWNSLPLDIQSFLSLPVFRQRLKTFLSRKSFPIFYYGVFVLTLDALVHSVIVLLFEF